MTPEPDNAAPRHDPSKTWQAITEAFRATKTHPWRVVLIASVSLLVGILETTLLYVLATLAVAVQGEGAQVPIGGRLLPRFDVSILAVVAFGVICLAIIASLSYLVARLTATMSARAVARERTRLLGAYLASPWAYRTSHREGFLQELMGQYTLRSEGLVATALTLTAAGAGMLASGIGALVLAPLPALVALGGLVIVARVLRPLQSRIRWASRQAKDAHLKLQSRMAQTARVSAEIASFDVGAELTARVTQDITEHARRLGQLRLLNLLAPAVFYCGAFALVLLLLAFSATQEWTRSASVSAVILLLLRALGYGRQGQNALHSGIEALPYVESLAREIQALEAHAQEPGSTRIDGVGHIAFELVEFEYRSGRPVLSNVSFSIDRGEVVGVMGRTGGGKTTLVQLLVGLRRPTGGRVTVDGTDLAEIDSRDWARYVALVPQDNHLIHGSIADNIRFYRTGFSDQDVEMAARSAHLHDDILALPEGYQTAIGPGARAFSGGERQRLGIARALLGHPQVLVLDEPTSALDERSEQLLRGALTKLRGETTIVMVAHRPSTLTICTRVLDVENGTVSELDADRSLARLAAPGS